MQKLTKILCLMALLLAASATTAHADDRETSDRINKAVMKVYDDQLAKNPSDYNTLLMRANQNYFNGDYDAALNDVNKCLELAPEKEKELRFDALMRRAMLHDLKGELNAELADLTQASTLNPSSLACVDMRGKLAYKMGDYDTATNNFTAILRSNPRNYDAMYMLACINAKKGKKEDALKWSNNAIELFPAEAQVYINHGKVLELLGEWKQAANAYLVAMASSDNNSKAIRHLFALAEDHYKDVMEVLRNATDDNPRVPVYYWVRATIAMKFNHFGEAAYDLNSITSNELIDNKTVYFNSATCALNLNDYDKAAAFADKAIALDATRADYYVVKSRAELNRGNGGNYPTAMSALNKAQAVKPGNAPAALEMARLLIAQNNDAQAIEQLNAALASAPNNAEALLLRAVTNKRLGNNDAAAQDLNKMLTLNDDDLYSLRSFALYESGRNAEAEQWAQKMIDDKTATGGEAYYYAAVLHAVMGHKEQCRTFLEAALANGYGNRYELTAGSDPYLNITKHGVQIDDIVSNYSSNFTIK